MCEEGRSWSYFVKSVVGQDKKMFILYKDCLSFLFLYFLLFWVQSGDWNFRPKF